MNPKIAKFFYLLLFLAASSVSTPLSAADPLKSEPAKVDPFAPDAFNKPAAFTTKKKTEVDVALISSVSTIQAGQPFEIAVEIRHPEHYHSYYKVDAYNLPLEFKLQLPEGFTHSEILWPSPKSGHNYNALTLYYENTQYFLTTITPPSTLSSSNVELSVNVAVQLCKESACLPQTKHSATLSLAVGSSAVENTTNASLITKAKDTLPHTSDEWSTKASVKNNQLILDIEAPLDLTNIDGLIFAPDTKIINFESEHTIEKTTNGYQLSVDLELDEGEALPDPLRGILTSTNAPISSNFKAVLISTALQADASEIKVQKADAIVADSGHNVRLDTPAEVAAMAELYDPSKKIKFITVDKIPDDLSDLSSLESAATDSANKTKNRGILSVLAFVFLGGMILNLMPCVFPVLGVKVLGFVQLSGNDPKKIKKHGLVFTLGLVVAMWILAGIILAIQASTGSTATWGEQMGNPIFVAIIIIFLVLFGLNLYGLFEIGTSLTGAGGNLQNKKGYSGSFFSGALTTLIATPCSGPFLGATLGIALSQPPVMAMLIFTVFALGIAFPYAILSFFPDLINKLPRPGAWMVTFKKIMAFPMIFTAAFFMRTLGQQTGTDGLWWFCMALVAFAFAAFTYGHWGTPFIKLKQRLILGYGLSALLVVGAVLMVKTSVNSEPPTSDTLSIGKGGLKWKPWKPGKVEHAKQKNQPLWLDYTAAWCSTCQTNKLIIFSNQEVIDFVKEHDIELIKVDMTLNDPVKKEDLARANRQTIPVNLIYPANPDRPAVLLEEAITPSQALKALKYALAP